MEGIPRIMGYLQCCPQCERRFLLRIPLDWNNAIILRQAVILLLYAFLGAMWSIFNE